MTQCDRVLRHLQDYGSITSLEAMQEYGIMRLGGRIYDLKQLGYAIETERVTGRNRYGELTSFARYSMKKAAASAGTGNDCKEKTDTCIIAGERKNASKNKLH